MKRWLGALAGVAAVGAGVAAYASVVRPRMLKWGATPDEARASLPGDELVPDAKLVATYGITIAATPAEVWPWLVQMGYGRGGWYGLDGMQRSVGVGSSTEHPTVSADRIVPEWQNLKVGDSLPVSPEGGIPVAILDAPADLVMRIGIDADTGKPVEGEQPPAGGRRLSLGWGWHLRPSGERATRLLVRSRLDYPPVLPITLGIATFVEPGGFFLQRAMMKAIRARVEAVAAVAANAACCSAVAS